MAEKKPRNVRANEKMVEAAKKRAKAVGKKGAELRKNLKDVDRYYRGARSKADSPGPKPSQAASRGRMADTMGKGEIPAKPKGGGKIVPRSQTGSKVSKLRGQGIRAKAQQGLSRAASAVPGGARAVLNKIRGGLPTALAAAIGVAVGKGIETYTKMDNTFNRAIASEDVQRGMRNMPPVTTRRMGEPEISGVPSVTTRPMADANQRREQALSQAARQRPAQTDWLKEELRSDKPLSDDAIREWNRRHNPSYS